MIFKLSNENNEQEEELKRKINMSDFLKKYYPEVDQLTKKDVLYITCPFCDDHNPSCMYNDETSKYPFQFVVQSVHISL